MCEVPILIHELPTWPQYWSWPLCSGTWENMGTPILAGHVYCTWEDMGTQYWLVGAGHVCTVPGRIWAPHTGWVGGSCLLYLVGYGHPILAGGGWSCVYCTWEDMGTPYWLVGAGRLVCPLWKVDLHEKQPPCLLLHFNVYYRTCQCCGYKYTEFGSGSWILVQFGSGIQVRNQF